MRLFRGVVGVCMGLGVLVLVLSLAGTALGQSATGTITGTITDPKGLAMVGVNVLIHNVDTGVDHAPVTTNDQGVYNVPQLQPGNYDITASQTGFSTVKRAAVTLQVGAVARIDIEMPVSAQQTLVTVTTEIPLLETEKTEQSQNVSESLVSNLPMASRNWAQFALLTPGVNPDGANGGMSFHGINNLYNNVTVDGANNNYNYDGGARGGTGDGYVYSPDSVREFQVSSSGFGADTGQSAGGAVNTVTKSGTNSFHGDLFYNGRAARFNAIDPVNAASAIAQGKTPTQNIHQQHQYGGSAGGPLWKDKLFFFTTIDQYRKVNPNSATTQQLSPTIQQLTCPTLTANGVTAGASVPNAIQCQAAKDLISTHYVGTFPQDLWQDVELVKLDSQINQANHVTGVVDFRDRRNRIDPSLFSSNPGAFSQNRSAVGTWTMVIGSNKVNELRYQYGIDNGFSSLNPNQGMPGVALSNIFTYGLAGGGSSWTKETRHQVSDNFSWTKGAHSMKFGFDFNDIVDNARSANNSGGNYQYSNGNAMGNSAGTTVACDAPTLSDPNLQGKANSQNLIFCNWVMDLYRKDAKEAGTGGVNRTGQHWDQFNQFFDLLYTTFPNSFNYFIPNRDYAGYFNDNWKLRSNITVNWGLRYDLQSLPVLPNAPAKALAGIPASGSLPAAQPLPAGSFDLPIYDTYTTKYPSEHASFQPRLGVAWTIAKNTVIRVSSGVFIAKTEGHNVKNAFSGAGETTTNCSVDSKGLAATCPVTATSPTNPAASPLIFPNVYFYQQNGALFTPVLAGAVSTVVIQPPSVLIVPNANFGIRGVDPTQHRPRVYTVSAALEQRLPGNMNLSLSYVYTKGIRLPRGRDFNVSGNRFDPNFCTTPGAAGTQTCGLTINKTYDVVDNNGVTVTSVTVPFFTSRPAITHTVTSGTPPVTTTVTDAPVFNSRVDPRTGVINGNSSTAYSVYNGFIVSLRKPMSHGFEVQGNYTLSLSKDSGQQGGGNSGEGQVGIPSIDPFNDRLEWGNSGTDTRNRFTASVIYQPAFEKYTSSAAGKQLLGGWTLASSIIAQNGGHYTAQTSGATPKKLTINGCFVGQTTACTTPFVYSPLDGGMSGVSITSPGSAAASRIAWLPSGSFVLPNLYNVDLRLEKAFAIKERYHIVIRGEAFNLFNSTLVQNVSMNAYAYTDASGTASTPAKPNLCPTSAVAGAVTPHATTVTCMTPVSAFQQATTTSGNNLRARELQAGIRFEF